MALLAEYALTPDVFDATSYTNDEVCGLHLQALKDVLLDDGLVRNLRDGEWARLFSGDHRPWHRRAKELLRKFVTNRRLVTCPCHIDRDPTTDHEWCDEALASHRARNLAGIIVTDSIAAAYDSERVVASVHRLTAAPWWTGRSPSLRLPRNITGYLEALDLVLRHANSIVFIDPHIDPSLPRYQDFKTLVQAAGNRLPRPRIEIHRVCYFGSGPNRSILSVGQLETTFRGELSALLSSSGLSAEVFIWDDFHDRYLISDLVGILVPNGFDTTRAANARTTWTRLGRGDRDDVQREFDPASGRHTLRRRFSVP